MSLQGSTIKGTNRIYGQMFHLYAIRLQNNDCDIFPSLQEFISNEIIECITLHLQQLKKSWEGYFPEIQENMSCIRVQFH